MNTDFSGAVCAQVGGDLWFPKDSKGSKPNRGAVAVCAGCPVRQACLDYALADPDLHGVWGGTTPRQRARMRGDAA